ncbi:hypothetical protein OG592_42685 (plasmid) [Streptomyces avidinii]|uniref:hypothetical protein n=1 Tax=Streptomyces avidinii TaxID=1895 RepID=UPI002F91ACFA|nr:hypothetical protein OG592_42685 [Streptomyces avidinii]
MVGGGAVAVAVKVAAGDEIGGLPEIVRRCELLFGVESGAVDVGVLGDLAVVPSDDQVIGTWVAAVLAGGEPAGVLEDGVRRGDVDLVGQVLVQRGGELGVLADVGVDGDFEADPGEWTPVSCDE